MSLDALCGDKLNGPKAGGIATTGTKRILDIVPKSIHERCPVFLGSKDDVQDLMKFYKEVAEE
jgi:fructose-1,6-bisphosphatase I